MNYSVLDRSGKAFEMCRKTTLWSPAKLFLFRFPTGPVSGLPFNRPSGRYYVPSHAPCPLACPVSQGMAMHKAWPWPEAGLRLGLHPAQAPWQVHLDTLYLVGGVGCRGLDLGVGGQSGPNGTMYFAIHLGGSL